MVRKIDIPAELPMPYGVKWDVRTASGNKAASGVYIWRVKSDTDVLTGKLMGIACGSPGRYRQSALVFRLE